MDALAWIGERRIQEATLRGELDDLPGAGRRLDLEDLSEIPDDLRVAYLALRTSGWARRDVGRAGQRLKLSDLLRCTQATDSPDRARKLSAARLRLDSVTAERGKSPAFEEYREAIERQLGVD